MKTPTDTELNLAMCEWMGWKREWNDAIGWIVYEPDGRHNYCDPDPKAEWEIHRLPNYLSDDSPRRLLNEAEAKLTGASRWEFILRLICQQEGSNISVHDWQQLKHAQFKAPGVFPAVFTTARHRVIALLQTVKPEMF